MKTLVIEGHGISGIRTDLTNQEVTIIANFRDHIKSLIETKTTNSLELHDALSTGNTRAVESLFETDADAISKLKGTMTEVTILLDKIVCCAKSDESVRLELFKPLNQD